MEKLTEEKKVNEKLTSGTYREEFLSLTKIGLGLNKGALSRKVQGGSKNSHPVDEVDINPVDSDISHLEATNNIVIQNSNATSEDSNVDNLSRIVRGCEYNVSDCLEVVNKMPHAKARTV